MDKRGTIAEYTPTEDELIAACRLFYTNWDQASSNWQEMAMKDANRWLLVWGHILPEMRRY